MRSLRLNLILVFVFLFGAAIIGRLIFLQIVNKSFYRALAEGQYGYFQKIEPRRGEIFFQDKEGNLFPAAISRKEYYVFLSPKKINFLEEDKKNKQIAKLANILNLEKEIILERIKKNKNSEFLFLKDRLFFEQVEIIKNSRMKGVYLGKNFLRDYPKNSLASHILGFVGGEKIGQYGIEGYYENKLRGERQGFLKGTRSLRGHLVFFDLEKFLLPEDGQNLILTIDYNIQVRAEKLLEEAKEKLNIKSGTIIVMEPHSGRVLTMANFPDFNPNQFFKEEYLKIFKNSATQKLFESGSVFKPIVIAAALNQGKITPETTFIDEGMIKIDNHIIRNFDRRIWGERTMTEVLEKSINTGSIFVNDKIGNEVFLRYIEKFGFFEPTQIDLQGEVFPKNRHLRIGSPKINFATASFGQGIAMTPIQLIRAFAIIANQGKSTNPHVLENPKIQKPVQQIISQKTASQLTEMLISAVEHPFRRRAQIPGYYVAGKTGTAQVPWAALGYDKAGYSDNYIHTFVGFAPAFNPRFVILVKLNDPQGVRTASVSAAPIFRELGQYIIDYYQIPPDYIK